MLQHSVFRFGVTLCVFVVTTTSCILVPSCVCSARGTSRTVRTSCALWWLNRTPRCRAAMICYCGWKKKFSINFSMVRLSVCVAVLLFVSLCLSVYCRPVRVEEDILDTLQHGTSVCLLLFVYVSLCVWLSPYVCVFVSLSVCSESRKTFPTNFSMVHLFLCLTVSVSVGSQRTS